MRLVIMAGGNGERMGGTAKCLLVVKGKTILQWQLEQAKGLEVTVSVGGRYAADVAAHARAYGVQDVLEEMEKMGTAGSLSLLPEGSGPVMVVNGDVLTDEPFNRIAWSHKLPALATAVTTQYIDQHRYGVVRMTGGYIDAIDEKPSVMCQALAGIYVLEQRVIAEYVCGPCDMPQVLNSINEGQFVTGPITTGPHVGPVRAYPITGYWRDIGTRADYDAACEEWA